MQYARNKVFLLQESTDPMYLGACLLRSIAISFVSEYHHHPSVRHLEIHQGIWLGQKMLHLHYLEKHLMGQVVYTFSGKNEHQFFCYSEMRFRVQQRCHHKFPDDVGIMGVRRGAKQAFVPALEIVTTNQKFPENLKSAF